MLLPATRLDYQTAEKYYGEQYGTVTQTTSSLILQLPTHYTIANYLTTGFKTFIAKNKSIFATQKTCSFHR